MCGRFAFHSPRDAISRLFGVEFPSEFRPRFNIAPTQSVAAIRCGEEAKGGMGGPWPAEPAMLRWGLVPTWAKDPGIGNRLINARQETVHRKPAFRAAFRCRRCVVLADGFYEWRRAGDRKIPTYISMKSGEPFAMAGLWERWEGDGSLLETCTIITTASNRVLAPIHERMPAILSPENAHRWIDPANTSRDELQGLLEPVDNDALHFWEVDRKVNNPRNDGPELIDASPVTPGRA